MELLALLDQRDALRFAEEQVEVQMSRVSGSDPETHEFFMGLLDRREEETFRQKEVMEKFASERAARPSDCVRFRRP
jgi:3-mercaptopyruvate sulfurtransferase SseA